MKESRPPGPPSVPASGKRKYMPWWLSIIFAIASYCIFKYLIPEIEVDNPSLQNLLQATPSFAPLIAIPFLLLAAKQLYDKDLAPQNDKTAQDEKLKQEQDQDDLVD